VLEQIIITTLIMGGVYALLAAGFSLIFGSARIINMAHSAFFMLAAYGMFYSMREGGLAAIPSIILTVTTVTIAGILVYRFLINRVRQHMVAVLLITIATALVFQEIMVSRFGFHFRSAPYLIRGSTEILGVGVLNQLLLSLGIAGVVIVIVWLVLTKTKLGIAIRATAQDAEMANLMGINVPRTLLLTMGLATALAAVAGIVVAPLWPIHPYMWTAPLVMVMVIVILGGLGSVKGSLIGAFIIALVESLVVFLVPGGSFLKLAFVLLAMVIVLVVRPAGLYGRVFEEERL